MPGPGAAAGSGVFSELRAGKGCRKSGGRVIGAVCYDDQDAACTVRANSDRRRPRRNEHRRDSRKLEQGARKSSQSTMIPAKFRGKLRKGLPARVFSRSNPSTAPPPSSRDLLKQRRSPGAQTKKLAVLLRSRDRFSLSFAEAWKIDRLRTG